jgi:hypothetical protein
MKNEKMNARGLNLSQIKIVPQTIPLSRYDCIDNTMDWEFLKKMISED